MRTAEEWMRGLECSHGPDGQPDGDGYIDLETIRAIQREAFDAGARAALKADDRERKSAWLEDREPWPIDITKLPGRPE